jgi:4-hydroxymandelate oxidase
MELKDIRDKARENYSGFCKVCTVCNGVACKGQAPGMGGSGQGESFINNYKALQEVRLNMRTIHNVKIPILETEILGQKCNMPVIIAPITGMTYNCGGSVSEAAYAEAIAAAGDKLSINVAFGDGAQEYLYNEGIRQVEKYKKGIPFIKPRENSEIIKRIKLAEAAGANAIGVDIDGAGLLAMALYNQPVSPKTADEIKELVRSTKLPLILKGVMTKEEAQIAAAYGAKAIVVSNHGGRALDCTPGVAEVLPEIAESVKGRLTIIADGAVRTGSDVLKYLALGADAVMIGRPIITGVYGNNADGACAVLNKIKSELMQAMLLTGVQDVKNVDKGIIFRKQ